MKITYKDFEINVWRDKTMTGDDHIYFTVYDLKGRYKGNEMTAGWEWGNEKVKDQIQYLKGVVDDFLNLPIEQQIYENFGQEIYDTD